MAKKSKGKSSKRIAKGKKLPSITTLKKGFTVT
jgi:hypothetical protein